ncbi:ubiquitin-conjugating enzyme E2-22 kDa-like [Drosophila subobscura]|uniref:ubiquitin-conjugating enzyme E2-22 kDa-like n=1 Tax=Drosophila subobscura TaxID=7241 RepID=UPI00155A205F|nr:ubiquitin-conjugating enzyme E2-22 kDa-like [Drosophila subobscura]
MMKIMPDEELEKCGVKIELVDDNLTEMRAEIAGPPDTPYEGGKFDLEIKVDTAYPYMPPKIRFKNRLWHPNVCSATGVICPDMLDKNWTPAMSLRTVMLALQAMLADAELNNPLVVLVACQYINNYDQYWKTAEHWTKVYAGGPRSQPDCDEKIQCLKAMGVHEIIARNLLSMYNWNLEKASERVSSN